MKFEMSAWQITQQSKVCNNHLGGRVVGVLSGNLRIVRNLTIQFTDRNVQISCQKFISNRLEMLAINIDLKFIATIAEWILQAVRIYLEGLVGLAVLVFEVLKCFKEKGSSLFMIEP